ncbi:MAG TPA: YciI family protein [Rhizomicrobium sp.]|nr:YciI family protein [Rhizomicrobium sp.]
MLYAILCYNDEDVVWSMSKGDDEAMMARLAVVQERLVKSGKLGPSLRLLPTTSATTLRKSGEAPLVIDGPFAETKEQLLGFFVIDVAGLDEALEVARELGDAKTGSTYEIRPIALYFPDERPGERPGERKAARA